jgi:adenylosuccinate lyase
MITIIENLILYPQNMKKNLEKTNGLIFSQAILLELVKKGISREQAYHLVQRNALTCWETGASFQELIRKDEELTAIFSEEEMKSIFSYERYTKHVDYIFAKVGIL